MNRVAFAIALGRVAPTNASDANKVWKKGQKIEAEWTRNHAQNIRRTLGGGVGGTFLERPRRLAFTRNFD